MAPRSRLARRHGPALRAGAAALLLIAALDPAAAAPPRTRDVLFLNSYQPGYAWSDDIFRAVGARMAAEPFPVELWVEYLDTRRFGGPEYQAELLRMIRLKYAERHFDLIVSSDDAALGFLLQYHDDLFRGVPVVFCGVNDESLAARAPRDSYTGIRELFGSGEILALASTLRPGTHEFVVITDASDTSAAAGEDYRALAAARPALSFTFLDGRTLSLDQILEALARVPESAAVIATAFERDATGRYFPPNEGIARIARASPAPVYSPSVSELGQGLLAGSENGGARHGRLAADLADRVLAGARPADLPIGVDKTRLFPVDWAELPRWNIDPARLPASAIVVNRPPSFYRANRVVVWAVGLFILVQAAIIGTLVENIRRRRRADRALTEQARRLAASNDDLARANQSLLTEMGERRQAEEQLRQAQKIDAVGRLAGGIAHDFNNLLTVISSYGELALDRLPPHEPAHAHVREIRRASERAASLTQQLLAFSRKQVLQPSVVSLNDVIAGLLPMLRRLISEDVSLTTRLAPDLETVLVDPGQIEQAIVNLVVNARDAMPGGGQLVIETSNAEVAGEGLVRHAVAMAPARYVLLAVSDSGHGMDRDTQAHIFEPFYTTKPPGHGTGLGLAMVYGLVKQSEGWIWVYSEPGQGTTVKIYLPPAARDDVPAPVERPQPTAALPGATVLVVDDQTEVRSLTARALRRAGYAVLESASPEEALAAAGSHEGPIAALVTDMVMPGLSGRDLATRLDVLRPGLRTLFVSGYTAAALAGRASLPADIHLLSKPFTAEDLVRAVNRLVAS